METPIGTPDSASDADGTAGPDHLADSEAQLEGIAGTEALPSGSTIRSNLGKNALWMAIGGVLLQFLPILNWVGIALLVASLVFSIRSLRVADRATQSRGLAWVGLILAAVILVWWGLASIAGLAGLAGTSVEGTYTRTINGQAQTLVLKDGKSQMTVEGVVLGDPKPYAVKDGYVDLVPEEGWATDMGWKISSDGKVLMDGADGTESWVKQ